MEQDRNTLLEHLSSPPVFSGFRVAQSLYVCVVYCRPLYCLSFLDMRGPMPQIFYFIIYLFFPYKVPSRTFQNRFYLVMTSA
jgi:hypothetical protein